MKEQFKNRTFVEIWTDLGDVPVNDYMEIEVQFLVYPAGTDCLDIWHDLEEFLNLSIGDFLFKKSTTKIFRTWIRFRIFK